VQASTSAENHNSNSKLAAGGLQSGALGSTGAMGPAGASTANGGPAGPDKQAGPGFKFGELSVGGDLGALSGLGSLANFTAGSLDVTAMRQLTVMRSSNMEHLLTALTGGQDGSQLFSLNSLTQDVSVKHEGDQCPQHIV
jgi:hypothetical protein